MKIEVIGKGFVYRWPGGEVRLVPGQPVELPPERAAKLMAKAPGRVRQVVEPEASEVVIEPAAPQARPVYYERNDGVIYGPAKVTDLAKTGSGGTERFWVIVEFEGHIEWVVSDRLRSKAAFETQAKPRPFERIKDTR